VFWEVGGAAVEVREREGEGWQNRILKIAPRKNRGFENIVDSSGIDWRHNHTKYI
jgi:hypothetical protein